MEVVLLFSLLFALMAVGLPIWVAMGGSALITVGVLGLTDATTLPTTMAKGVSSYELLAIPFFILTGELMNRTGMTTRIVRLLMFFLGRLRGGLAYASVGVNVFASGVSGSAPADAAAVSAVMLPAMRKEGYRPERAAAVNASAAVLGPIMPPSIPMIFVALVTNLSIGQLFIGGVGPALLLATALLVLISWQARRGLLPAGEGGCRSLGQLGILVRDALPALAAPALIVAGIFGGFATITEIAMLAAAYVLVVGMVVYRTVKPRDVLGIFTDSAVFSSTIMILFAVVGAFTFVLTLGQLGETLSAVVTELDLGPTAFLLVTMVFFLIVGMPMDAVPAIVIFVPVLLPIAMELGVDPIHFGVIVVVNLMIGLLTPPVGALLYVLTKLSTVSFGQLSRAVLPYVAVLALALLVMTLAPPIVTWLPQAVFG
ncbi:MAG: TRAP transporter large permease subunit [Streptosporangiales bacterium]|nr:TRAP transporter large permease subunit [Streptosporangiales bacterium]